MRRPAPAARLVRCSAPPSSSHGTTVPAGISATVQGTRIDFTPNLTERAALAQVVYTTASGEDEVTVDGKTYSREDFGPEPYTEPKPPARKREGPECYQKIPPHRANPRGASGNNG